MTLTVTDLSVRLGGRTVVDSLSFSIADGERFGLIGESGSGKSVTAQAILGLLPEQAVVSGSIRLDGTELIGLPERQLAALRGKDIGIVFQEPRTALNPLRRVGDQIAGPLIIHEGMSRSEALARAIELAADVKLPEPERIVRRYPHQLSGGQLQRVSIAIAIAASPRLLIADEPTTALDVTTQAEILDLFDDLIERTTMSLLFVTHDLAVLSRIATDVVVLAHGRAVEAGQVRQIVGAPRHPVTVGLVDAARATTFGPIS